MEFKGIENDVLLTAVASPVTVRGPPCSGVRIMVADDDGELCSPSVSKSRTGKLALQKD